MNKLVVGEKLKIHKYKHNGELDRCWEEATYLDEDEDYMVFANYKTLVIEKNGRMWKTKEPAIMYFSKKDWFNIIGQIKKKGVYYYCNIASPFLIEDKVIKYISSIFAFKVVIIIYVENKNNKFDKKLLQVPILPIILTYSEKDLLNYYIDNYDRLIKIDLFIISFFK